MAARAAPIVRENVLAMRTIHAAVLIDELGLFRVADRLVELWLNGRLPAGSARALDAYRHGADRRLDAAERRTLYRRCFGTQGGDAGVTPNREFQPLWLRFLAAVSAYGRQTRIDDPLRLAARREAARKAGRDLAANLSLHGAGLAPAARSLGRHVDDALAVLRADPVQQAYGARDVWEVVDRVSAVEFGRVPPSVRLQTQLEAGLKIIDRLAVAAGNPPTRELVEACERWLAAAAVPDGKVERHSQPVSPRQVRPYVDRLLGSSHAFAALEPAEQKRLAQRMSKVAAFVAEPTGQVDFAAFVADLLRGLFGAVVDASIEQMRAYGDLLAGATRIVDRFVKEQVTAGEARRWLVLRYPDDVALTFAGRRAGALVLVGRDRAGALVRICAELGCDRPPARLDGAGERVLVAAARRRLARNRQQLLATMVLMGVNR